MKVKQQGFFRVSIYSFFVALLVLALAGCGDGGGGGADAVPSSVVLTTSLGAGNNLAQGGVTTMTATVLDVDGHPVVDGTQVTFTASNGNITGVVTTAAGKATANYSAANAAGVVTITASAGSATGQISLTVASGSAAVIETVSVTPERINLRESGSDEIATIVFSVQDNRGNPVADGTLVDFTLDAQTGGGEQLSAGFAYTVGGEVTVSLVSGSVPGVATVTATIRNGTTPTATEVKVTMGYGKPNPLNLSIFFEKLNVPGLILFNESNTINAAVADRYSNPVPENTPVYFASECGIVSLSTNLTDAIGVSSVEWITANPVPADGRCTSIVWTKGEETFIDTNGNGVYDDGEYHENIGEPYIDANESRRYEVGEQYFDLDRNGVYTEAGSKPLWDADTFIWTAGVVAWSGRTESRVEYVFDPQDFAVEYNSATSGYQDFNITIADQNGGPLPEGSKAEISTSCANAELTGETSITIPDTGLRGPLSTEFSVTLSATQAPAVTENCSLEVKITADPNGDRTISINGSVK